MTRPLNVLILEDRPEDAELMVHQLRRAGFAPRWSRVDTQAEFLAGLEAGPDVVLSDFGLPQFDPWQALSGFGALKLDIPFILVSGTIGEERAVEAMRRGGTDYVSKDHLERLGAVVTRGLEECRLRRENRQTLAQMKLQVAALEAAANGIVITDREGAILWANTSFLAMTGYTLEEIQGHNPRLLKSGEQTPAFYEELWQTILAGRVWKGELTNRRKNGTLYQEEMTITPVHDAQGRITHFIAIKQDITERIQLQEQFLQAQKMEVVGRLAGGVAHDFNNLLTVMCGFGELLRDNLQAGSSDHALLTQIILAGERAAGLTRQLLAFSRKQVLQPQVLDLNAHLEEAKKMLGRLLGEDIQMTTLPGKDLHRIKADPGQIQQVLMNLAVNARDAMSGGGKLTLATSNMDLDERFVASHRGVRTGPHVLLEVCDTGCGMTAEVQARIFEPFFTTKGPGKGTGLGLATVIGIVEQSGGTIAVESRPGWGTVFRIYLPRADEPEAPTQVRPSANAIVRGGERILLVEDDPGVRSLAAVILRDAGYDVLEAVDGEQAVSVFEAHSGSIHLLMTDVVMPGMDGCRLAGLLKARAPGLRVLFVSGYLDDALAREGIDLQNVPFLHKPFTPRALLHKVREALEAQPTTPE